MASAEPAAQRQVAARMSLARYGPGSSLAQSVGSACRVRVWHRTSFRRRTRDTYSRARQAFTSLSSAARIRPPFATKTSLRGLGTGVGSKRRSATSQQRRLRPPVGDERGPPIATGRPSVRKTRLRWSLRHSSRSTKPSMFHMQMGSKMGAVAKQLPSGAIATASTEPFGSE